MKKALFFDIDGTIWDRHQTIPDSTIETIRRLKERGHLSFICTGRSKGYVTDPRLYDLGFDGMISGCGTMIEYHGETLFYTELDPKILESTIQLLRRYHAWSILEGREYLYLEEKSLRDDAYGRKRMEELHGHGRTVEQDWGRWEASKLTCIFEDLRGQEACFRELQNTFEVIVHRPEVVELVPKGYDKGTGIRKLCGILNIDLKDTFAFGDGANDLGMFRTAGTAVAMGDGADVAKDAADYVTSALMEDGIMNACIYYGLI